MITEELFYNAVLHLFDDFIEISISSTKYSDCSTKILKYLKLKCRSNDVRNLKCLYKLWSKSTVKEEIRKRLAAKAEASSSVVNRSEDINIEEVDMDVEEIGNTASPNEAHEGVNIQKDEEIACLRSTIEKLSQDLIASNKKLNDSTTLTAELQQKNVDLSAELTEIRKKLNEKCLELDSTKVSPPPGKNGSSPMQNEFLLAEIANGQAYVTQSVEETFTELQHDIQSCLSPSTETEPFESLLSEKNSELNMQIGEFSVQVPNRNAYVTQPNDIIEHYDIQTCLSPSPETEQFEILPSLSNCELNWQIEGLSVQVPIQNDHAYVTQPSDECVVELEHDIQICVSPSSETERFEMLPSETNGECPTQIKSCFEMSSCPSRVLGNRKGKCPSRILSSRKRKRQLHKRLYQNTRSQRPATVPTNARFEWVSLKGYPSRPCFIYPSSGSYGTEEAQPITVAGDLCQRKFSFSRIDAAYNNKPKQFIAALKNFNSLYGTSYV